MKKISFFIFCMFLILLAGCGNNDKPLSDAAYSAEAKSKKCILCHSKDTSPITTANIVNEWQQSDHNIKNGADCYECHRGGNFQHPKEFASVLTEFPNIEKHPEGDICFSCHEFRLNKAHYAIYTSSGSHPAQYLAKNYQNSCISCHDPHNPKPTNEHKQWAKSGHGDTNGVAWSNRDFKDNVNCIRCHTSTGYIDYVTNNFVAPDKTWATSDDNTREVLTCKACHTNYNFKNSVRSVAQYTASYNENFKTTKVTYPDVGISNICIPCHSGRESGESVRSITNFKDASFKNPHYLAAAGVFYAKAGYHFYTSVEKYDNYTSFKFEHSKIGMTGRFATTNPIGSGTVGQCVGCHLGNAGTYTNYSSHTFNPVYVARSTGKTGCYGCHSNKDMATLIEEEKEIFKRGMDFFKYELERNKIYYRSKYPYFFVYSSSTQPIKDWTAVGPKGDGVSVENNMGAAFNYKLLEAEKGAYVHNRNYAKRLISHSIFYLQTGKDLNIVSNRPAADPDPNKIINFRNYSSDYPTTLSSGEFTNVSIYRLQRWLLTGAPNYRLR